MSKNKKISKTLLESVLIKEHIIDLPHHKCRHRGVQCANVANRSLQAAFWYVSWTSVDGVRVPVASNTYPSYSVELCEEHYQEFLQQVRKKNYEKCCSYKNCHKKMTSYVQQENPWIYWDEIVQEIIEGHVFGELEKIEETRKHKIFHALLIKGKIPKFPLCREHLNILISGRPDGPSLKTDNNESES